MPSRRFAALVLAAVATLASCGSSSDNDANAVSAGLDDEVVAVGAAPAPGPASDGVGSIGDAVQVAVGALGGASEAACAVDHQTLQSAVETYELLNGTLPTSQQALVDAQMIREPSVYFDISSEGAIVPAAGSECT